MSDCLECRALSQKVFRLDTLIGYYISQKKKDDIRIKDLEGLHRGYKGQLIKQINEKKEIGEALKIASKFQNDDIGVFLEVKRCVCKGKYALSRLWMKFGRI